MKAAKTQTAFRLRQDLINRLKRKARARGQSLNSYVESILMKDSPPEPVLPKLSFPLKESDLVNSLHFGIDNPLPQDVIDSDERLQHILGLDRD